MRAVEIQKGKCMYRIQIFSQQNEIEANMAKFENLPVTRCRFSVTSQNKTQKLRLFQGHALSTDSSHLIRNDNLNEKRHHCKKTQYNRT